MAHGLPVTLWRNLKKQSMYTFTPCEYGPQEQQPFHTSDRWWLFICGFKTGKLKLGHKHFPTSCAGNVFQKSSKVMPLNRQQKIATLETLQVRWQGALSPSMKIRQSSPLPFRDDAWAIHKHRLAGIARIFPSYVTRVCWWCCSLHMLLCWLSHRGDALWTALVTEGGSSAWFPQTSCKEPPLHVWAQLPRRNTRPVLSSHRAQQPLTCRDHLIAQHCRSWLCK